MLKEALQYILDGMRPETQDLCGRAYVITPSGAQEVIETPIVPATLQLHSLDSIVKMIRTEAIHLADANMATEMTKTAAQPSVLDLLLSGDIPNVEKELPTAAYKIDRLSDLAGHDVVFKLKALPYGKVHDIERFTQDTEVHILLAGCVEPNLKDERLLEKFGGATPADAVKKMLLAGEITDLAQVIERLSGYRRLTITEVKNV